MSDVPSNVVPLHACHRATIHPPNAVAMLRSLGATVGGLIPDCGASLAEIQHECRRFGLPACCAWCGRNPDNTAGAA